MRRHIDAPRRRLGAHGSISVTRSVLAAGLVDELRLVVSPTIVGTGKRLLDGLPEIRLDLISRSALAVTGSAGKRLGLMPAPLPLPTQPATLGR